MYGQKNIYILWVLISIFSIVVLYIMLYTQEIYMFLLSFSFFHIKKCLMLRLVKGDKDGK